MGFDHLVSGRRKNKFGSGRHQNKLDLTLDQCSASASARVYHNLSESLHWGEMLSQSLLSSSRLLARVPLGVAACGGRVRNFGSTPVAHAPVETVAVIGSGLMGSGIAQVNSFPSQCICR